MSGERSADSHPRTRMTDSRWGKAFYWWRNIVPLIAMVLAFYAVRNTQQTADEADATAIRALDNSRTAAKLAAQNRVIIKAIDDARATAILDACHADIAQDDVLRAIIHASLKLRRQRDGVGPSYHDAVRLSRELMAPLGGLRPLRQKEITSRCQERLRRGSP